MSESQQLECFMCLSKEPKPVWIPLLFKPRVVCCEACLKNYSWGLDFT